jgi:hypothetical protein
MKRNKALVSAATMVPLAIGLAGSMALKQGKGFQPSCSAPSFPDPTALGIDAQCGTEGAGGKEATQNSVKNNFCASGTGAEIGIADLATLQKEVEKNPSINFGSKGPTTDRSPLQQLGEGQLVSVKAFVFFAKQEGKESVNCGTAVPDQPGFHDIHILLVDEKNLPQNGESTQANVTKQCSGVVAEMTPHHRPAAWTAANVQKVATAGAMVRVTGQQFFDSSHVPCNNGVAVGSNPKRVSLWEVHPIYKIEVCTSNCTGAGTWLPLDQWVKQH